METNTVTGEIVSAAMKVHTALGPGLLESVYRRALVHELRKRGLKVVEEMPVSVHYDGVDLGTGLRLDLLVEDCVIVELKSVERMRELFQSQLPTHLKLAGIKTGLLINFNVRHLRHGITRMVR